MPSKSFLNMPQDYVVNELKKIATSPANIRRLIFFDRNGTETTLKDRSGNGLDATLSLPASSLDPATQGKAKTLHFNAAGDYWEIADANDLSFGNAGTDLPFSLIVCGRPSAFTNSKLIAKADTTTGDTKYEYTLDFDATKNFRLLVTNTDVTKYIGRKHAVDYSGDSTAYHTYFSTYDGGKLVAGIKLFKDGVRVDDTNVVSTPYPGMTNGAAKVGNYSIGADGAKSSFGTMNYAVVAIIAEELSQAQITQIDNLLRKYVGVM